MKKRWYLFPLGTSLFLLLTMGIAYVASRWIPRWYGLIVGGVLLVATLILCLCVPRMWRLQRTRGRDIPYMAVCAVNAAANGFCIAAYYTATGQTLKLSTMLYAIVATVLLFGVMLVAGWLLRRHPAALLWTMLLLFVAFMAVCIWQWIAGTDAIASFGFFAGVVGAAFSLFLLNGLTKHEKFWKNAAWGSFGAGVIVFFVVLVLLSEGELLEGLLDVVPDGGGGKRRRK